MSTFKSIIEGLKSVYVFLDALDEYLDRPEPPKLLD